MDIFSADMLGLSQSTNQAVADTAVENISRDSVLDTLRSIQEDNPQIETIFIDSDDDEEELVSESRIEIHDILTHTSSNTSKAQLAPVRSQNSNVQNSPFLVREISPSRLTANIVKDSNTIVLQDESKGTSSKSYLVIPKEVLPLLARSQGPIALNVPGIGPLIIPKPSEMAFHAEGSVIKNYLQIPGKNFDNATILNSGNNNQWKIPLQSSSSMAAQGGSSSSNLLVGQLGAQTSKNLQVPAQNVNPTRKTQDAYQKPYDPLSDQKYCWRLRRGIKRDLDGYSLNDRLGFYKAEVKRGDMCLYKCRENVKKLEYSIHMVKRKLAAIQGSKLNMDKVKVVEIDAIKNRKSSSLHNGNKITTKMNKTTLTPLQKKNLETLLTWKERFGHRSLSESDHNDIDNDLLVTRKVVVVNGSNKRRGRKKKVKLAGNTKEKDHTYCMSKPIYTGNSSVFREHFSKSKREVEVPKRRGRPPKRHTPEKAKSPKKPIPHQKPNKAETAKKPIPRQKPIDPEPSSPPTQKKRGRPRKVKRGRKANYNKIPEVKPCSVELSHVGLVPETLKKYQEYYKKIPKHYIVIDSIQQLQKELNAAKPILVINEKQCAILNLAELSATNNLIFPTTQIDDLSTSFVTAAEAYKIKFVEPDILCKYLSGVREAD